MPVLAWSPIIDPTNWSLVSFSPLGVHSDTVPYVFLRLLVVVPAPRLTQRPSTEWPTKPSCDLLAWPIRIDALSSPCTRQPSPIDDPEMRSVPTTVSLPITHGPTMRVNACTVAP